jgi:UDP-glucose 4-epimerase
VLDVVPALHDLIKSKQAQGMVVNLGNDEEITINQLAERVQEKVNSKVEIIRLPYEQVHGKNFEDMKARQPNLARAQELINYRPSRPLDAIIDDVFAFYRGKWNPEI